MRRVRMLLVAATVMMMVPLSGHAGDIDQHAAGSALLPTKFLTGAANGEDPLSSGYPGVQRRLDIVSMGLANGVFGYVFNIDQSSWCDTFTLKLDSSSGTTPDDPNPDIDIYFYSGWDDEIFASDVITSFPYEKRGPSGETGFVPPDVTRAMVFSYNTINASFTYEATSNGLDPESEQCLDALPAPV